MFELIDAETGVIQVRTADRRYIQPPSAMNTVNAAPTNSATTWSEFEQSEEFRDFDAVMEEGLAGCLEFQAQLDATEARGVFSDTPWIPGELKEVVDAALGCDTPLGE